MADPGSGEPVPSTQWDDNGISMLWSSNVCDNECSCTYNRQFIL